MRTKALLLVANLSLFSQAFAQTTGVGIGTLTPDASAALDVSANGLGLLVPRVALVSATDATTVANPAASLLVYNTATTLAGKAGLAINLGTTSAPNWQRFETANQNWSLTGNAGTNPGIANSFPPGTSFLGTTDNQPLAFRTNNTEVARLQTNGALTLGSSNQLIAIGSGAGSAIGATNYTFGSLIFIGQQAGAVTTTSAFNCIFVGVNSGLRNTSGGSNIFIGADAGSFNTTGSNNLFIGHSAGNNNSTASYNHFVGIGAGSATTTGNNNFFDGYQSGFYNTTGSKNHYSGISVGNNNRTGTGNTMIGFQAGLGSTNAASYNTYVGSETARFATGSGNTFLGYYAGYQFQGGNNNTIIGNGAGYYGNSANNLFVGYGAGQAGGNGSNHCIGYQAGYNSTAGFNQFDGNGAGYNSTSGGSNLFVGFQAGYNNTAGNTNQFMGYQAGRQSISTNSNLFVGYQAGFNTTSSNNQVFGYQAGINNTSGTSNLFVGYQADLASSTQRSNATAIGYQAKVDRDNSLVLGGTGATAVNVGIGTTAPTEALHVVGNILTTGNITAAGTITQNSDRRLKTNIRPLTGALASVEKMRGVRYTFLPGKGPKGEQVGVIAQEVEKFYPELVHTDRRSGIKSVNYSQLTPVLLEAIKDLKNQLAAAQSALTDQQAQTTASLEDLSKRLQALEAAAGSPRTAQLR